MLLVKVNPEYKHSERPLYAYIEKIETENERMDGRVLLEKAFVVYLFGSLREAVYDNGVSRVSIGEIQCSEL